MTKIVCISNSHIKQSTFKDIQAGKLILISYTNKYGAIVQLTDVYWEGLPTDLVEALEWARLEGIAFLMFDPEGLIVDRLNRYGW